MCPVLSSCLNKSFIYCIELGLGVFFGCRACVLPIASPAARCHAFFCVPLSIPVAFRGRGIPGCCLPALSPEALNSFLLSGSS